MDFYLKILIYGINYSPELVGIGKYSGEMGAWLVAQGHEVTVITAPPYYPDWRIRSTFSKWLYSRKKTHDLTIWRCPLFVPLRPNALLRLLHLISFALSSLPIMAMQILWRPNIVFLVAPTLFCAPGAILLAKLTSAKSIIHIQDFEVDALFSLDLLSSGPFIPILKRVAYIFESFMLRSFDLVSTISIGMMDCALNKGVDSSNLRLLTNWSEISRFKNPKPSFDLLHRLGVHTAQKIILYSGNMGEKQGLENVLLAAQYLQLKKELVFLLVGDGASRNRLLNMASDLNLQNVIFAPLQSNEDFPALLGSAYVHLVIQKRGVADAVLPSKLTNILAAGGNAVITADPSTTLGRLPAEHPGIALVIEPESVEALIFGIEKALTMPLPNPVAQNYAREFLDKEVVLLKFFNDVGA